MEFVVGQFGERLRLVREARGLEMPQVARTMLPPDATPKQVAAKASWLSRIELKNENVSLDTQILLARGLGFPRLSTFWIAIEQAINSTQNDLQSAPTQPHNLPVSVSAEKAATDVGSLPTAQDLERVAYGSVNLIVDALERIRLAIDQLANRLASRKQSGANPRAHASHRSKNSRQRTG